MAATTPLLLPEIVAARASSDPTATLLHEIGGPGSAAGEVHSEALRWAQLLGQCGVRPGDPVATMLATSTAALRSWLGAAWIGAIDVPLNPDYAGTMLESVLNLDGPEVVVIEERLLPRLVGLAERLPTVRTVLVVDVTGSAGAVPSCWE